MSKPLRVLIVEDSEEDAELLVRDLESAHYRVVYERVQTAEGMTAALAGASWDIVLSDCTMPGFSATAALEILQKTGHDLPFIIVSGTIGEETAVSALKAGAHDFLVKGRPARLIPAIERELREAAHRDEQRRTELALRVSEAQYRSLVEHAIFGIYRATVDGRFLTVNPALVRMLGYDSAEELLRVDLASLSADEETRLVPPGSKTGDAGFSGEEVIWKQKSGATIRVRLSGHLTEERLTGRPMYEVLVENVTEQYGLQEQLRRAQRMEALGQLAGGVAHDFNNVLTAILGYTELLTDEIGADKPIVADLRQIKSAADRATALTRQLLAFSRKQVLAVTPLDLTEIVRSLEPMLRRLLGAPITIESELSDPLRLVMADAAQMEHLLIALAVNARDAMPQGGVLTIATRNVELDAAYALAHPGATAGPHAALSVADAGVGMSREVQDKIFEPFFTTKERGRGTGLGLAAVYGTVKQLNGYIEVESQPAQGSRFTIYLPTTAAAPIKAKAATSAPSPAHETILLVDDEPGVRALAKTVLGRAGYRVFEMESAEAALTFLEESDESIDLLLTDLVLPGMSGHELAVRVARDWPTVRLMLMSGYVAQLGTFGSVLGPDLQILEKPFSGRALLTKAQEILANGILPAG